MTLMELLDTKVQINLPSLMLQHMRRITLQENRGHGLAYGFWLINKFQSKTLCSICSILGNELSEHVKQRCEEHKESSSAVVERIKIEEIMKGKGFSKGSVGPRSEPAAELAVPIPKFDTEGSSRLIAATGDASSKEIPLQSPRSFGPSSNIEGEQKAESAPDTEAPMDTSPLPGGDPAAASEAPASTETAGTTPTSPTPVPRSDNLDDIFSDTPPATGEAASFGHLPIPWATRAASWTTETSARDSLVGDASSKEIPLQSPRRSGPSSNIEGEQRAESAPDTEAPMDTSPLPDGDPAAASEAPASTETAGTTPTSPTPVPRSDNLDDKFSDTPPATGEAASFGHLPIPRATRAASWTTETSARDSLSVVLVNEVFIRAQHKVDYLKGQLDTQGCEAEKFQHLLREKEDQLSRAAALSNLQPEFEAAKAENLHLKVELAGMVEKNRLLEVDKAGLSQDNPRFTSRLGVLEATISELRSELDSVKVDAVKIAERHRLLESENARDKEKLRVVEQKAENRVRISDELKSKSRRQPRPMTCFKPSLSRLKKFSQFFSKNDPN
ncbi:uncharacterized protein LOC132611901 [Lycium barbarum]|uniref:uncharacterized protein LOC132611901 n=1 Tax=Lycium barbarum TaxID=112863 RepID=UPI00293EA0EF|nr:uncharacterized protein LOC132611901 [Lycium barbarum]